jgi:hypothetical protein
MGRWTANPLDNLLRMANIWAWGCSRKITLEYDDSGVHILSGGGNLRLTPAQGGLRREMETGILELSRGKRVEEG